MRPTRERGRVHTGRRVRAVTATLLVALGIVSLSQEVRGQPAASPGAARPRIGVALGGGSARGLAHVGVLRWLEEHRIPIDVLAGTSMGGLIGGSYATGMTPDEIEVMLSEVDWNAMFGSSSFQFASVRRKRDFRAYPSHLEFGLRGGIALPPSLNNGQQVDLLLARLASPYYAIATFDELPTPFRCVAVDLRAARPVVLDRGSLALAMRATMSLPLVFPPVQIGDQVLVDGGAMNNIPADVARGMGADRVIAVNVGDLNDPALISSSLLGLAGSTLDAMMRASTLKVLTSADVVINIPLGEYGSLAWRRYRDLIRAGYDASEAMKEQLLPLAVDQLAWEAWRSARAASRRTSLPVPRFVRVDGAASADAEVIRQAMSAHVGQPLDLTTLETTLAELGALDRYEALRWELVAADGMEGLLVRAHPKPYAPPFLFLGVSLENTTSSDFRFGLGARYLAFDALGSGSELRLDAAVGSDPSAAVALYRPLWSTPLFVEAIAGIALRDLNVIQGGRIAASYRQTRTLIGLDAGLNLDRLNEVRAGAFFGRLDASVQIGDPGLPELGGRHASLHLQWTHDGQDSAIVPSRGLHLKTGVDHFLDAPEPPPDFPSTRRSQDVTQAEVTLSRIWSLGPLGGRRLFVSGGAGTSFDGHPLPTEQFSLGGPLRLGAFNVGERRGDHYALASGGYLHEVARLPDLLGASIFLGGWLETGTAFDRWADADVATHVSAGIIADSLIGPVFASVSAGFDGVSRFYLGIGQIFR